MGNQELDRILFHALLKDKETHYIVTNDGWFIADFYADSDEEAIEYFRSGKYKEKR